MVEAAPQSVASRIQQSKGSMFSIFEYIGPTETTNLQSVNKNWYNKVIPNSWVKIEMPSLTMVFESQRKHLSIGQWREGKRDCTTKTILKIGDGEGEVSPAKLGFSEVYFQYFIQIDNRKFIAFPIEQEAILKKGFEVTFDKNWQFESSRELAQELGDNTMRPTACLLKDSTEGQRLLMLGGRQDRSSSCYSFRDQKWSLSPKLPLGHNITTTITVNWKEKVVFTFIIDAQLTIKSAFMDLQTATWTDMGTENTSEMTWAMELKQEEHKVDRLHIKGGIALENGDIAIVARGRKEGQVEQISGLIFYFKVNKSAESGAYSLSLKTIQRVFPSIFCRQLDFVQVSKDKIVVTQDTADEEKFEAFSIDMTPNVFRGDGVCQKHMRHIFAEQQ